jgi:hypothetical protein
MTTPEIPAQAAPPGAERWKRLAIFLILVNTAFTAMVAALQADANIRASQGARDAQYYSILVSGELLRTRVQSDYDLGRYSDFLLAGQQANILEYTALQLQFAGDERGYQDLLARSQVARARADRVKALNVFFTDPRYAPPDELTAPDMQAYLDDLSARADEMVRQQNEASDRYHRWNDKADAYVAILTILAIAFFLLGISQTVQPGLRLLFAAFAALVMAIGLAWTLVLILF